MAKFSVNTHHAYLNNDIVIKTENVVTIEDLITRKKYEIQKELRTRLTAGRHILKAEDHEEEIFIEDAIKLGGSRVNKAFVFDGNPWIFVTTKDRLYITNIKTDEDKVEYNITPDEIIDLPSCADGTPNNYFLLKTHEDFAIYNALTGKIVFQFKKHIFTNEHLTIFRNNKTIEVFDFRIGKQIVNFESQYSIGKKLYFVKDNTLFGLNLKTSEINKISYVGKVKDYDVLLNNNLLRLNVDTPFKKCYLYFSLGDGENEKSMSRTEIISPYYIESWCGESTSHFEQIKVQYNNYKVESSRIKSSYPEVFIMGLGIKITNVVGLSNLERPFLKFYGEIIFYPITNLSVPFVVEGKEGETINFSNYSIRTVKKPTDTSTSDIPLILCTLDKDECKKGESKSGNLLVTQDNNGVYLRDVSADSKCRILQDTFDSSNYVNAYFTSDGKNVFLNLNNDEAQLFGLENLSTEPFEVGGFTLAKNEGFNGYKPEILLSDARKPVWRDPINLGIISEKEMSSHVFKSPDGKYIANIRMKTILYNRLTKSEISSSEANIIRERYNWTIDATEEEKKCIIEKRKELVDQSDWFDLFGKIIDANINRFSSITDETERERELGKLVDRSVKYYITKEPNFASLILDNIGYVCYKKNGDDAEEKLIRIGRNVYFLNYVSFSYDSKYLSFAAKMREDEFRSSQEGVFEIYDLDEEKIIQRVEDFNGEQLWAVWMTMFSRTGDVVFYDSHSNAYLVRSDDNYERIERAPGKSLLCFSPSGRYIACSDQNYIDFTHHPNGNWGHQPSGNVFIHETNAFGNSIEQYNDLGDGVLGVSERAGSVSSAAFSQDETKLLVVGNDGVVVIRNLKRTKNNKEIEDDFSDYTENDYNDDYGTHYGEYEGSYAQDVMGYSDDVIGDAFDGEPDAYWNID